MEEYSTFGRHEMADFYGVSPEWFEFTSLFNLMELGVTESGANIECHDGQCRNGKKSIMILLTESHYALHMFPEQRRIFVDCYTCGETVFPSKAIDVLMEHLKFKYVYRHELIRGVEGMLTSV